ncbi:hypothetical protein [Phaeobacter sp. C3_T13_0]|uniref:hypothetical protein n=1 Tax=Phaeobacter cretensis TaxID=3342641 RepID=UPI0039BCAD63
MPNAQILIEWANSLGFDLVLRPRDLPTYTRRVVAESRGKQGPRQKRFRLENRRRSGR